VSVYFGAFLLGNAAILGNVCMLPLYPGLIAFLAGSAGNARVRWGGVLLGAAVLAGVLVTMAALGFVMFALGRSFSGILPWLLPLIYGVVLALGVAMLLGKNPFARVGTLQAPLLGNPYAAAFAYGGLLAPMTLPCTGPVVVSAFVLGVGSAAALGASLGYFLAFGLGFGWPLVVLPLAAAPLQRGVTRWLAGNTLVVSRIAGALLIAIAVFGVWVDLLPNLRGE
jgi:cytochrome c-type biogenesis protein